MMCPSLHWLFVLLWNTYLLFYWPLFPGLKSSSRHMLTHASRGNYHPIHRGEQTHVQCCDQVKSPMFGEISWILHVSWWNPVKSRELQHLCSSTPPFSLVFSYVSRLVDDDHLALAQMEDVPSVLSEVTAALRPDEAPQIYAARRRFDGNQWDDIHKKCCVFSWFVHWTCWFHEIWLGYKITNG